MESRHFAERLDKIRERMLKKKKTNRPEQEQLRSPIQSKIDSFFIETGRNRRLSQGKSKASAKGPLKRPPFLSSYARSQPFPQKSLYSTPRPSSRYTKLTRPQSGFNQRQHSDSLKAVSLNKKAGSLDSRGTPGYFQYVLKLGYRTKRGCLPNGQLKINQDSLVLFPKIGNHSWQHYFGVCDGHGNQGHYVSGFLKDQLPKCIFAQKDLSKKPSFCLRNALRTVSERLSQNNNIDTAFSGSTCVGVYMNQDRLFCVNVGDSRAIIVKKKQTRYTATPLSSDHKPDSPGERERIVARGGEVQPYKDGDVPMGPARVWVKGQHFPGLAMSRSFGDKVGGSVGVVDQPEIKEFKLCREDKIILVASDGVFQFLSNDWIAERLGPFYERGDVEGASESLLRWAQQSWQSHSNMSDDISFILLFMEY